MTIPLCFRAALDALTFNDDWHNFWFGPNTNYYEGATYNIGIFFFATYIPMLMQIFSLMFGFMKHKKVKMLHS